MIEDLVELYLFTNKKCPLPTLGSLQLKSESAQILIGENKIEAPVPSIKFSSGEIPPDDFIEFIAGNKHINAGEAAALLTGFCTKLQQMSKDAELLLPNAGRFFVEEDGNLVFEEKIIPKAFYADIPAKRVAHTGSSHSMVVGNNETTNEAMTAFLSGDVREIKEKWWIWAAVFFAAALSILVVHFTDLHRPSAFGNKHSVEVTAGFNTYQVPE